MPNQRSFGGIYKNPSSVNGLSIDDIMNLDPNRLRSMTEKEIRQITSRLISAANKRISRMSYADRAINPAIHALASGNLLNKSGKLTLKKATDKSKLMQIFYGSMGFLKKDTSTARGLKEYKKKLKEVTSDYVVAGAETHDDKVQNAWQLVYEYFNYDTQAIKEHYKEIFDLIHNNVDKFESANDLFDAILSKLDDVMSMEYEDAEADYGEFFRPEEDKDYIPF